MRIVNLHRLRTVLPIIVLCFIAFSLSPSYSIDSPNKYEFNRARLLGYMLQQDLESHHFSHKKIDNSLSLAAYGIYIRQLDPQKRFLLRGDVLKLNEYSDKIDDEISSGNIELPIEAAKTVAARTADVVHIVKEVLSEDFDFTADDMIETDPEKLDYCADMAGLKERWRVFLKSQVLNEYLTLLDEKTVEPTADEKKDKKGSEKETSGKPEPQAPENLQKKAREKIQKDYETALSKMQEKERDFVDRYFGAITKAFDPHTEYMPPASKEDFDIGMRGSFEGIGATLQEEGSYIKVMSVMPGGPAALQGQLQAEDLIIKVAEKDKEAISLLNMGVKEAVRLIRGKKGTEVLLTVRKPDGVITVIPIVRDVIQFTETFARGTTIKEEKSGKVFGYIKLPTFYRDFEKMMNGGSGRNSTDDVKAELKKLIGEHVDGVVLDLRNNGGGALTDAVRIAGLFIDKGPIVQVKSGSGKLSVMSDDDDGIEYAGPLVVLVNQFSASASEILAGALQDYGRAVIIGGEHTHGKGTVQSIFDLNENIPFRNMDQYKTLGALRLTIQKFYRISGETTQFKGVVPDIILPDRLKGAKTGEQYQEFALPWDTISPADYSKWPKPRLDISVLKARSLERIKSTQAFIDITKDSARIIERQKTTLHSLRLDNVRKEREEAKARRGAEGQNLYGHPGVNAKPHGSLKTEEEKRAFWSKEAESDPYVREAIAVLSDIIASASGLSMN